MLVVAPRCWLPRAPVYLLHGTNDPIVPANDAEVLSAHLREGGTATHVYVTDVFERVDAPSGETPSIFAAWPMLGFLADALDDAGL